MYACMYVCMYVYSTLRDMPCSDGDERGGGEKKPFRNGAAGPGLVGLGSSPRMLYRYLGR